MRYATILAIGAALISGTNNFLAKIAVAAVRDPLVFTTLKNAIVAVFLIGLALFIKKLPEITLLTKTQVVKLFVIGVIGGSAPFALFFIGLAQTSALNASMIHKTLFLWVALLAIPLLKERMTRFQWVGIALIFVANFVVGGFTGFKFNAGEFMILAATLLWAVENIIAKVALRDISSITVAAARMTIGSAILAGIVAWRGGGSAIYGLNAEQFGWTFLTSVLLFGFVLAWYTALKHAPVTYVATLLIPATLITNVLSAIFITRAFSAQQLISVFLLSAGIFLVVFFAKRAAEFVKPTDFAAAQTP